MMIQTPGSGGWVTSVDGATSVWRLEAATGEAVLLADGGYLPGWLP